MESILQAIEKKEDAMMHFLEKLVNIDSGVDNPEGIKQVASLVGAKLSEIGFQVNLLDFPGICTHVLARKPKTAAKQVMIIGHLDTVFPKGTAAARPFTVRDGKAYGPGVLDMKSGVTIALFALEALMESDWDDKDITVFFAGDEETGHPQTNAAEIFIKEAGGKSAVFNMETASAGQAVLVGRKGNLQPFITVKGLAAHAGADLTKGCNAIEELAHKIIAIQALTDFDAGITYNVGVISGGSVVNMVPDQATAAMDVRFSNLADIPKILADLEKVVKDTRVPGTTTTISNTQTLYIPMEVTEGNLQLFEIVRAQGRKLGFELDKKFGGGCSDSGYTVKAGAPTLCAMGARGQFNHSDREYIELASLVERAKLLALSLDAV